MIAVKVERGKPLKKSRIIDVTGAESESRRIVTVKTSRGGTSGAYDVKHLQSANSQSRKQTNTGENQMNNVFPLRPDPLRNLYELIDSIHDTNPTPETKRIADEALALVQKMIEARNGQTNVFPA